MRISDVEVRVGNRRLLWIAALAAVASIVILLMEPFQTAASCMCRFLTMRCMREAES